MVKENIIPLENKKPFETVQELKSEYEIPSFEEFMKTYESDEEIVRSYEDELKAKAVQGPQYGPGKENFGSLYRRIKSDLGLGKYSYPTYKISCDSDYYRNEDYDYAGAIVYMLNGKAEWENKYGDACGRRGKSFYVIIKITDFWPSDAFGEPGNGVVHDYLVRKALGYNPTSSSAVCAGGFAWRKRGKELRFGSVPLNSDKKYWGFCENDETSSLSYYERVIVRDCWEKYKSCNGDFSRTYDIPYEVNSDLSW